LFDTFEDPFVLTPGDNDWTDCHRLNNGAYNPLERLDAVRDIFFPVPGQVTGGRPMHVLTQAADPEHATYVERTCASSATTWSSPPCMSSAARTAWLPGAAWA